MTKEPLQNVIYFTRTNFRYRRWGPSLPGLRMGDPPLGPLLTLAGISFTYDNPFYGFNNVTRKKRKKKRLKIFASANGGPRSRVYGHETPIDTESPSNISLSPSKVISDNIF